MMIQVYILFSLKFKNFLIIFVLAIQKLVLQFILLTLEAIILKLASRRHKIINPNVKNLLNSEHTINF